MKDNQSNDEQHAHITAESFTTLKTPQERSIWAIKLLSGHFLSYIINNNIDPDKLPPKSSLFDFKTKFNGHTLFSCALSIDYYTVAKNYIVMNKKHPDFEQGLNLQHPETQKALKKLFTEEKKRKKPIYMGKIYKYQHADTQALRNILLNILSPITIAQQIGMTHETEFSAALKLGKQWHNMRPVYRILKKLSNKSQEDILTELNLTDPQTASTLKEITDSHNCHLQHRILTAKLQQILSPKNFVEKIRGKKLSYQDQLALKEQDRFDLSDDLQEKNILNPYSDANSLRTKSMIKGGRA